LTSIENNLVNDFKIDIHTFLTLCVLENINVLFLKKKMYYELLLNDSDDVYVIKQNEHDKYGFEQIQKKSALYSNYTTQFYKIDCLDKPIKSITYYKVCDLVDICNKFSIDTNNIDTKKQKTKKELYESIMEKL